MVGRQRRGSVVASYATGYADGGNGDSDQVGGLFGQIEGSVVASYATSVADGGFGDFDYAGVLYGRTFESSSIVASYGYGDVPRGGQVGPGAERGTIEDPLDRPSVPAMGLTAENVRSSAWNSASSGTLNAWDFGDNTQLPALVFNDYDGASTGTDYSVLFAGLTTLTALIPNQRLETSPQIGTATTDIQLSSGDTANRISGNIQLPATFNGENLTWSVFYDPAPSVEQISVDNNNVVQINASHRNITRIIILRARGGNNSTIVNDYHLRIIAE